MNDNSQETLRRVAQDDPSLTELILSDNTIYDSDGKFYSYSSDDYSTLGSAIANNTHLENLAVTLSDDLPLGRGFYDDLKCNTSIHELTLRLGLGLCIVEGVAHEILQTYQENNSQLTVLEISDANLRSGGDRVVVDTLRICSNLQRVTLNYCNITDARLLPIVDAIRGHRLLEELDLYDNNIGNAGCDALATLLEDPNCNLHTLDLWGNNITDEGAIIIANSLVNNTKLHDLDFGSNAIGAIDQSSVEDAFSRLLFNTSIINSTFLSNHTLNGVSLIDGNELGTQLASLLIMNEETNKRHVAIKKILKFHPDIDMDPMFEWDAEGEQSLKALPYVVGWFERAGVAIADNDGESYHVEEKTLSAIFQFAKGMPLLFVPTSHIKVDDKKRKRGQSR